MDARANGLIPGLSAWRPLGRGGFGTVFVAWDEDHAREVAVKVLDTPSLSERAHRTFDQERHAMGRLSAHPNIVVVHRSGVLEDGRPFIVMEHLGGGSLADLIVTQGAWEWVPACQAIIKIAGALATAHSEGVLHRDVKPGNIMRTTWGEPKLGDFGIARLAGVTGTTTSTTSASVAHAAPEVLDGQPATPVSDVYSLASTLHHLLSGSPPFVREGDESIVPVIARVLTADPPDLVGIGVPEGAAAAVRDGLAKEPSDRSPSPEVFGRALTDVLRAHGEAAPTMLTALHRGHPVDADTTGTVARPGHDARPPDPIRATREGASVVEDESAPTARDAPPQEVQTRSWLVPAGLLISVAVVLTVLTLARGSDPSADGAADPAAVTGTIAFRTGDPTTGMTLGLLSSDPGLRLLPELGAVGQPAVSPDGRRVAVDTPDGLMVVDVGSGESSLVMSGEFLMPAWSPDGGRVAYAAHVDGQLDLFIIDLRDGSAQQVTDDPADEMSPSWSPDGELIAHSATRSGDLDVWLVHVDGSGSVQLTTGPEDDGEPAYHPDGDRIAFVRTRPDGRPDLAQVPASGGEVELLTDDDEVQLGPSWSPDGRSIIHAATSRGVEDLDLRVLEPATGEVRTLLERARVQADPSWGP